MFYRAHPPEVGAEQTADLLEGVEEVDLPWDLVQSFHVWGMVQNGILPYSGGYLEQPRAFRRLMELFNMRYGRMQALTPEQVEDKRMEYREELDPLKLAGDVPAVTSFDAFRRG